MYKQLLLILRDRFHLDDGKAYDLEVIDSIRKNIEVKGANLWVLIFAIFLASIGLNVNSTAIIIGGRIQKETIKKGYCQIDVMAKGSH